MVATLISTPRFFFRDPADDTPLAGGKVYTYIAGTTTPKTTWADYDQGSTLPNPVVLDADGGADIFGNGAYRIIVRRADETLVYEVDNVVIGDGEGSGNVINRGEVIYTTDHAITAADDGKILIANRPTAITFTIDQAVALGSNFAVIIKNIGLGTLTLDPSLTDLIDGAGTKAIQSGASAIVTGNGTGFRTLFLYDAMIDQKVADAVAAIIADPWALNPIGAYVALAQNLTGVPTPPTNKAYRYIKLTAADAYNTGFLGTESVTGSAPLVQATAIITDAGSPMNGQTVRLINTERRFLRAGSAGTVEADSFEDHSHTLPFRQSGANFTAGGGNGPPAEVPGGASTTGTTGRTANETRGKNIGVTYYMRIK